MPSPDVRIVPVELIPRPPYSTPSDDLPLMYAVAKKMEILCESLDGLGVSAAQVGLPWRMFVFRREPSEGGGFGCYFDCQYEGSGGTKSASVEGCLSLPGQRFSLERYDDVVVAGNELYDGEEGPASRAITRSFSGLMSVLMQHEIDHDHGRERMIDMIGRKVSIA